MTGHQSRRPIAVAVGNHFSSDDAIDWAAAEAAATGAPLLLLYARHRLIDRYGETLADRSAPVDQGQEFLRIARKRVEAVAPDLHLITESVDHAPALALLKQSQAAALLVLGSPHFTGVRGMLARSAAQRVAARSECPVVLVSSLACAPNGTAGPRVVIGIDAALPCRPALDLAFGAARQRSIPVVAVRAWRADVPADLEGVCGSASIAWERAADELQEVLKPWQERFPDVTVVSRLIRAEPVKAVVGESVGAALVVVNCGSTGILTGGVFGSVSRRLLHQSCGPVVVVSPGGAVAQRQESWMRSSRRLLADPGGGDGSERGTPPRQ